MPSTSAILAASATAVLLMTGCGSEAAPPLAETSATPTQEHATLDAALERADVAVTQGRFEGGMSEADTLQAFSDLYQTKTFEGPINVYAATIEASGGEASLWQGREVRIVHVANVPQEVSPPYRGPSDSASSEPTPSSRVIKTDMVAFFDAKSGEHLTTMYIGDGPLPG